jgi:hypothetical protein
MHIQYSWRKPEERRPLGRPRCRCVKNIKMGLTYERVVWTALIVNMVTNIGRPIKCREALE